MIWLCICLTPGHTAEPGDANHSPSLTSGSAVTLAVGRDAPWLNSTVRSARDQGHPCVHEHFTIDVCSGRRDYPLGSNAALGLAQVNNRPTVPLPSGVADRARSRGRVSQAFSTIDHEGSFSLLPSGHGQDRDKPLAILLGMTLSVDRLAFETSRRERSNPSCFEDPKAAEGQDTHGGWRPASDGAWLRVQLR